VRFIQHLALVVQSNYKNCQQRHSGNIANTVPENCNIASLTPISTCHLDPDLPFMEFALTIETSIGLEDKVGEIVELSNKLSKYFSDKNYGADVKELLIGTISVAPEFEFFTKPRKPRYTLYRRYVKEEVEFIEDKLFGFSLKLDYDRIKNQSDEQNRKMLAKEILQSLSNLDSLPKKVKDFDKERFIKDMQAYFAEQDLI